MSGGARGAVAAAFAIALLLPWGGAPVRASELTDARVALDAKTAQALDDLAAWCQKKRLFGKRDETYAKLLEFDGQHAQAREKLRYSKGEDGGWVQDPKFKVGTNWKRGALPEYEKRLAAVLDAHRSEQLALYAKAATIADLLWARGELTAYAHRHPGDDRASPLLRKVSLTYYEATRERGLVQEMAETAAALRSLYPEDVDVRATLGETKHGGRWMLLESANFLSGAAGLDQVVKRTLDRMGRPPEAELDEVERKIALPWTTGSVTTDARAVGTAKPEDLRKIAMHCQAAGAVFVAALETEPVYRGRITFYVFAKKGERETLITGYPVVTNPSLKRRADLDIVNLDAYAMAVRAAPPIGQLDGCVYQALKLLFSDTFLESETCRGWHAAGIVRYLAFKILGTRFSVLMSGRYAGQGKTRHVPESEADWLLRARAMLAGGKPVGLQLMLGKGLDALSARDATLSYAFAVYLIEGHRGLVAPFVRSYEKHADVDKACLEILGLRASVVEHRLRTWLGQVSEQKPPKKGSKK